MHASPTFAARAWDPDSSARYHRVGPRRRSAHSGISWRPPPHGTTRGLTLPPPPDVGDDPRGSGGSADRHRLAGEHLLREDRHDTGLPVGTLPRAIHICVSQHRVLDQPAGSVRAEIVLERQLARAILRGRARRGGFGHRHLGRIAVDGGRRRVNHAPRPARDARAQHVQAAQHVHSCVEVRLAHRPAHIRLRRRMKHNLRPEAGDDVP